MKTKCSLLYITKQYDMLILNAINIYVAVKANLYCM